MDGIHKISNITSDQVIYRTEPDKDGKVCEIHKLVADREYVADGREHGLVDIFTGVIVNQAEYDSIMLHGYYPVHDGFAENYEQA